jgi:HK97 gp10 family phage protein
VLRVEVDGADRLAATLEAAGDDLADLEDAGTEAGRLLVGEARRRAPKRSGALAATVTVTQVTGQSVRVSAGSGRVVYAGVQENGWRARNIRARRFMRGALTDQQGAIVEAYRDEVDDIVDTVKGA